MYPPSPSCILRVVPYFRFGQVPLLAKLPMPTLHALQRTLRHQIFAPGEVSFLLTVTFTQNASYLGQRNVFLLVPGRGNLGQQRLDRRILSQLPVISSLSIVASLCQLLSMLYFGECSCSPYPRTEGTVALGCSPTKNGPWLPIRTVNRCCFRAEKRELENRCRTKLNLFSNYSNGFFFCSIQFLRLEICIYIDISVAFFFSLISNTEYL